MGEEISRKGGRIMTGIMYRGGVIRLLGHASERCGWLTTPDLYYAALSETAYAPTNTDTNYQTIKAAMEVATGGGYAAGGKAITPVLPAYASDTYDYIMCDSSDPAAWTAATFITDGSCIWDDYPTNDPLICWLDFGGDKSVTAGTLTVVFDAKGVFRTKISF
jgi:hypothetical protein